MCTNSNCRLRRQITVEKLQEVLSRLDQILIVLATARNWLGSTGSSIRPADVRPGYTPMVVCTNDDVLHRVSAEVTITQCTVTVTYVRDQKSIFLYFMTYFYVPISTIVSGVL